MDFLSNENKSMLWELLQESNTFQGISNNKFNNIHSIFENTITNINKNSNVLTCNFTTILLYYGPIVLMGYARIMKGCHNLIQVIAGYILGFIIANIVHYFETVYISYIENIDPNKDRDR